MRKKLISAYLQMSKGIRKGNRKKYNKIKSSLQMLEATVKTEMFQIKLRLNYIKI